jgi:hypothetical protein
MHLKDMASFEHRPLGGKWCSVYTTHSGLVSISDYDRALENLHFSWGPDFRLVPFLPGIGYHSIFHSRWRGLSQWEHLYAGIFFIQRGMIWP